MGTTCSGSKAGVLGYSFASGTDRYEKGYEGLKPDIRSLREEKKGTSRNTGKILPANREIGKWEKKKCLWS